MRLVLAVLALALSPGLAPAAETKVSYLAGGSVYLEAGRLDGLGEGDTLTVLRDGVAIARLRVTYLSSRRASCDTLAVSLLPKIGDRVRFIARAAARADSLGAVATRDSLAAGDTASGPGGKASSRLMAADSGAVVVRRPPPLRGRIGAQYLSTSGTAGTTFSQPALDLRIDGTNVAGTQVDLAADVRGRRSSWTGAGGQTSTDRQARVYRSTLSMHDASGRRRLTVGRQSAAALSPVSLFDGALAEIGGERWSAGAFSGAQPWPATLQPSRAIVEYGGFMGLRRRDGARRRWQVDLGGVSSYQLGQPNRDFIFTQGLYQDSRFTVSGTQEADIARGWKRALGEPSFALTSSFATARLQVTRRLAWRAGFDNRRNVRLYRDRLTPESDFDDRYRIGAWSGASLDAWRHLRLDGDYRTRGGAPRDRSHTWSGSAEAYRVGPWNPRMRMRISQYRSDATTSDLVSLGLALEPWGGVRVEATGGTRSTTDVASGLDERVRWQDVDLDVALLRRWYLNGSWEQDRGGLESTRQGSVGLSWRF
jgi:hypothetical protein